MHEESDKSDGSSGSESDDATAPGLQVPGQEDVHAGAESLLAADSMASRASKMFGAGASEPRGSGLPPACGKPSKLLVQIAWKAAKDLCDTHGKALSKAFGNFDRVVALGWLLGDAVGAPLLSRTHAHAVGTKARRVAVETTAEQAVLKRTAQRAASKLAPDNPRRQELAAKAKEAEASLLRATVDFPALPAEQSTTPSSSGSRKRKLEPEPVAPSQDQLLSILDDKVLKAEKDIKRALAAWGSAEKEGDEEERRAGRLLAQVEAHDGGPGWNGLLTAVKRQRVAWDACSDALTIAELRLRDTQLPLKDAELAAMFQVVEMGLAREEALLEQLDVQLEKNK